MAATRTPLPIHQLWLSANPTHTLPPVPLSVTLRGGTTVSHSPSIDYFTLVTAPLLRRMGIHAHTTVKRRG